VNTSHCSICGLPKLSIAEYQMPQCNDCTKLKETATQSFIVDNPDAPMSDALYAGRMAMMARAHTAHRNAVDPRDFSATRGVIPKPPVR